MDTVRPLIESGDVTRYSARPLYEEASLVPSANEIRGADPGDLQITLRIRGQALAEEPAD